MIAQLLTNPQQSATRIDPGLDHRRRESDLSCNLPSSECGIPSTAPIGGSRGDLFRRLAFDDGASQSSGTLPAGAKPHLPRLAQKASSRLPGVSLHRNRGAFSFAANLL